MKNRCNPFKLTKVEVLGKYKLLVDTCPYRVENLDFLNNTAIVLSSIKNNV